MAARNRRSFHPRDLMKQVMIQEICLSSDGSTVVYARRTIEAGKYRKRLWRVSFEGGRPEQLTTADAADGRPRVSPDGRSLLFLSDRSGRTQPWVMPLGGGEPKQLSEFPGEVTAADWSPDGERVVVVGASGEERFAVGKSEDPTARVIRDYEWRLDGVGVRDQFNSVWVARVDGGKPRRLTKPAFEVTHAFWSPDGRRVGFLADLRPEAALEQLPQAWSLPADGGAPRALATLRGAILAAAWGPSGALAVIGIDEPLAPEWANHELFVLERGELRQLGASLDVDVMNTSYGDLVDFSSFFLPPLLWVDSGSLVAIVADRGRAHPHRFGLDGSVEPLADGEIVCSGLAAGGGRVVVVANERGNAGEVYAVEDGSLRRLTGHGSRWMASFRRDPERIAIPHPDGHEVDTWLLTAGGRRRRGPAVIQVHGGPNASHGPTPWLEMLALADRGMHVLWSNPRGSTGYGEKFARATDGAWGDADGSDLLRVVDWAVAEGLADPDRLGILGLSYGGFMTNWMLAEHPGRFAAGVSENPVTDVVSLFGQSDAGRWLARCMPGGTLPAEGIEGWLQRSSYLRIHRSEAPLLLLQCEQDLRCPPGQSEIVFAILRSLGRNVEMVRYPEESHVLVLAGRPDRRVDRVERIVDWFATHLGARRAS